MIKEYVVAITNDVIPSGFKRFENEYSPEQELIRCKNCKYWNPWRCTKYGGTKTPDWFCADGERR